MIKIFVSHAQQDAPCAEFVRHELEVKGYTCWRDPDYPSPTAASYPHMIENALFGSAALVLVWSASAAQDAWVMRHILFAQRLKKNILPVVLDSTTLPDTLVVPITIMSLPSCEDAVVQLLPHIPAPESQDSLFKLCEMGSHEFIQTRKDAIDLATTMLAHNDHRDEVLAYLEYLTHDPIMSVRDRAKEVVEADARKQKGTQGPPSVLQHPEDAPHIFPVTCEKCGHINYFDKRRVCSAQRQTLRFSMRPMKKQLDTLLLPCANCPNKMLTKVDCEGY